MKLILLILLLTSCSNAPLQKPDICYGLQGETYEDCILRMRKHEPKN